MLIYLQTFYIFLIKNGVKRQVTCSSPPWHFQISDNHHFSSFILYFGCMIPLPSACLCTSCSLTDKSFFHSLFSSVEPKPRTRHYTICNFLRLHIKSSFSIPSLRYSWTSSPLFLPYVTYNNVLRGLIGIITPSKYNIHLWRFLLCNEQTLFTFAPTC